MVPELEKPRVTELQLRMDCNGCIQKIKKALHNVDGVYEISIDFPQQKLTIVGRAELEKILKAIKKTRKIATICSHVDPNAPPPEQQPENVPPAPAAPEAPPAPPPPEPTPAVLNPEEPPKEPPPPPPNQEEAAKPSEEAKIISENVHTVHYYPYTYHRQIESPRSMYQWSPPPRYRYSWMENYNEDSYYCQSRQREDCSRMNSMFSEENANSCVIM